MVIADWWLLRYFLAQTGYSTDAGVSGVVESIASYYYDYTNKRDASYSNTTDSNNGQSMTLTIKDYANVSVKYLLLGLLNQASPFFCILTNVRGL